MTRPSWDEYFLEWITLVGKRSTCDRGRIGCIFVKDNHILSSGYAGSPPGLPHCDDVGHEIKKVTHSDGTTTEHCLRTTHAELNAIGQAARRGESLDGSTLYATMTPCYVCAKMLITCGVRRIVVNNAYQTSNDSLQIFKEAGIEYIQINQQTQEYKNE